MIYTGRYVARFNLSILARKGLVSAKLAADHYNAPCDNGTLPSIN
jgi:hypothetical protein